MLAIKPALRIPGFYLCDDSLPRTGALLQGSVLAAAFLAGVCLLIARGGTFPLVSRQPPQAYLPDSPVPLSRTHIGPTQPLPVPFYFRQLTIVSALDADRDGVISEAEIAAAPRTLAALDTDHDGKLTADECGGNFKEVLPAPNPSSSVLISIMSLVMNHDVEVQARLEQFIGRRGPVSSTPETKSAALPVPSRYTRFLQRARLAFMRIHPILAALDADRNGEISAAEIRNAAALLRTLDRNGDGRLSEYEIIPGRVASSAAQFICVFDIDNNGALSPEEWTPLFGKRLRRVLTGAGSHHNTLVNVQDLVSAIDSASSDGDTAAYREMVNATHDGFAAIVGKSHPHPESTGPPSPVAK